jgi:hypothetical protein
MEQYQYTCQYCGINYTPKRRKKQKYCTNSCRTRAYQLRNPKLGSTVLPVEIKPEAVKIDKMSPAGVGNVIAGTLIADGIETLAKKLFINEENKPATKKDIEMLKKALSKDRYKLINGLMPRQDGFRAYFDSFTNNLVYFPPTTNHLNLKK